jgi:hypothetical protein
LNYTTPIASPYEAFSAEGARWLRKKLEIHYTMKHGNRLNNMTEIEVNVIKIMGY